MKNQLIPGRDKSTLALKKTIIFIFLAVCVLTPIFAGDSSSTGIDAAVEKVTSFLSNGIITALCLIALVIEAAGVVVMGKQGADIQTIIGKFAPWVVGTIVLLSANGICNYFLSGLSFSSK
jgi:hypothetical protein